MSNFASVITSQAEVGLRFYLKIQGIPYIFLDGPTPVGSSGTWSAPSGGARTYTYAADTLDVSAGIVDNGARLSRSSGDAQPSQMAITLKETRAGFLHGLMGRENPDGNYANLVESLGFDDLSGAMSVEVDSASGWSAEGFFYFGRETVYYDSISGGNTFEALERSQYALSYCDTSHDYNDASFVTPRVITDFPRVWHGRYVQLFAFLIGPDGLAYDTAIDGDYSQEIWRGVISGNPRPLDDWERWQLNCDSIEKILDTDIGREPVRATLLRVPGSIAMNQVGQVTGSSASQPTWEGVNDEWQKSPVFQTFAVWLDENTRYVDMQISVWASQASYTAGDAPTIKDYTGSNRFDLISPDEASYLTRASLGTQWNAVVKATTATDTSAVGVGLEYNSAASQWFVQNTVPGGSTAVAEVTIFWDAPGSVGRLLGFSGQTVMNMVGTTASPATPTYEVYAGEAGLAGIIPAEQNTPVIPFFYVADQALPYGPTEPGYAKIGDGDDAEIIYYDSIDYAPDLSTLSTAVKLEGLYLLRDVKRGQLGTKPIEHRIELDDEWKSANDAVEILFGTGVSGSFVDVMMQLAVSTGVGNHGSYDTLAAGIATPLSPSHFDTTEIGKVKSGLTPQQDQIQLFISKPMNLRGLVSDLLRPHGLYMSARPNADGDYLITVDQMLPPLESEAQTAVGTSVLDITNPASYVDGLDRIINQVRLSPIWDAAAEDNTDDTVTLVHADSISEFGSRNSVEWKLKGYTVGYGLATIIPIARAWAARLFARYGRPYDLFELNMSRAGLTLKPGDVITLTIPGAPNATGTRGISSRDAVVLHVGKVWHPARGGYETTGATVTVVLEQYVRASTYSPSARIASYNGATPSVTLHPNAYTLSGQGADVDHFDVGDVVVISTEGDASTKEQVTITAISGNVVTISTTLSQTVSSTETIMNAANYDACQASQRKHAFIADASHTLGSNSDDAFTWV